ncbi:sensor histidine kinase [Clostridium sardiniense]|uniref:sensor histidine kinase n=1 Tax=Clostridium sardiniense TaxID=29369 RepID=UPI0019568C2B|nr:HAMP domain-containing sensor histidine kinase [Clostridium sardiniense]MBM7833311.1 signal transduction histidine kinase [Clostridium sardiniense]
MSKSKSKKNKNKNVTSIAIKMNAISVRDLFFKFLLIDICLIIILVGLWCMESEKSFYGELVQNAQRSFNFYPIETANYTVTWDNGKTMVKEASTFLYSIIKIIIVLGIVEGIFLLEEIIFGTAKIRKVLKPLNEIAETASRLSNMDFDEEKFQSLEEAIAKISPVTSDERIHIGDSELQGLEDAINKLLDRMRNSYRQQARFVSDASHELRTPISVIQGYANMLDRWGKNDESVLEESITAIKSESENMKNLVEQLLFLARGVNGKTQLTMTEFSLNDMMNEVLEESKMIDKNHIYSYINSENIIVYGDIGLLKQTARILVENAAKYTEYGEVITLRAGKSDKGEAYFSIQDNGIGMDGCDIPHIFERFFRADTARVRKDGGTGLGLSIAKWIIDNHKGYFSVLSRKEIGTRVTVFLPQNNK